MDCRPGFFKQSLSSVAIVGHIYTYIFDDNILTLTFHFSYGHLNATVSTRDSHEGNMFLALS